MGWDFYFNNLFLLESNTCIIYSSKKEKKTLALYKVFTREENVNSLIPEPIPSRVTCYDQKNKLEN